MKEEKEKCCQNCRFEDRCIYDYAYYARPFICKANNEYIYFEEKVEETDEFNN